MDGGQGTGRASKRLRRMAAVACTVGLLTLAFWRRVGGKLMAAGSLVLWVSGCDRRRRSATVCRCGLRWCLSVRTQASNPSPHPGKTKTKRPKTQDPSSEVRMYVPRTGHSLTRYFVHGTAGTCFQVPRSQ